jgi:hypothetical protein
MCEVSRSFHMLVGDLFDITVLYSYFVRGEPGVLLLISISMNNVLLRFFRLCNEGSWRLRSVLCKMPASASWFRPGKLLHAFFKFVDVTFGR